MQYIKVLATNSTNTDLKDSLRQNPAMPNTCLAAQHQKQGRGQRGTKWQVAPDKNLTFSILLKDLHLEAKAGFKLSALIGLNIVRVLDQRLPQPRLKIKWPNDILAENRKICGILIENILQNGNIQHSVIGIGLNVNQTDFKGLSRAGSLKTFSKKDFNTTSLLTELCETLEKNVYRELKTPITSILTAYQNRLQGYLTPSVFQFPNGRRQRGIITGITPTGLLKVEFDGSPRVFNLKEIKMVY